MDSVSTIYIGGCSCSGKTTLAKSLSKELKMLHTPLDAFRKSIDNDALNAFSLGHETWDNTTDHLVNCIHKMNDAMEPSINKWADSPASINAILEGENITPGIINKMSANNAIFIIETDHEVIRQTLLSRNKNFHKLSSAHQITISKMNVKYSLWLREKANEYGLSFINSQPWDTLYKRARVILLNHSTLR